MIGVKEKRGNRSCEWIYRCTRSRYQVQDVGKDRQGAVNAAVAPARHVNKVCSLERTRSVERWSGIARHARRRVKIYLANNLLLLARTMCSKTFQLRRVPSAAELPVSKNEMLGFCASGTTMLRCLGLGVILVAFRVLGVRTLYSVVL